MTLPDPIAARKPPTGRVSRFWLYAPYVALLVVATGWSVAWFVIRAEVAARMDAAARSARDAGYTLDWKARRIDGYPFRIEVTLDGIHVGEPSGWALSADQIKAETYAYALGHWVAYAPGGVVLNRPLSGPLSITGPALRASYAASGADAPRLAIEGLTLAFNPKPGAGPFWLKSVEHIDFHSRRAGPDQIAFLVRMDGASAPAGSLLNRIGQDKPMTIAWAGRLERAGAISGRDWPAAARAWMTAGGGLQVEHGLLSAGPVTVNLQPGRLDIDQDGRLRGTIGLDLAQAPNVIHTLAVAKAIDPGAASTALSVAQARAADGPTTRADLTFLAGVAAFGPVAIGPAPRVY
jgi:hypothetical protein